MRRTLALCILFLAPALALADFSPTPSPVSPDGTRAVCDLPVSQHMKNTGGNDNPPPYFPNPRHEPGKGSGLCVFTSVEHAARWHNVSVLAGFQKWMTMRPGGGWPQKLDAMLKQFCSEKGVPVPPYLQHTGGDAEFLELALKTDRIVCVTYAGLDDFYRDRAGRPAPIAHMVNLAHMDGTRAAIIDNNRPGVWVWMTRDDFLRRWRANGGGWAVAFLAPPPPPYPERVQEFGTNCGCVCGAECTCAAGECPSRCPVVFGQNCSGGRCGVPALQGPAAIGGTRRGPGGCGVPAVPFAPSAGGTQPVGSPPVYSGAEPPGSPPGDQYEWRRWDDAPGYGWRLKDVPAEATGAAVENYGLDTSKIHAGRRYTLAGGVEIDRDRAHALIAGDGLTDDSDRWHLTAVGDAGLVSRFRADVAALPGEIRSKLHVQAYAPDHWAVSLYTLPAGVSLRRPSPGRESSQVGALAPGEYTAAKLDVLLYPVSGKTPPTPPAPPPAPQPEPVKPTPAPGPAPAPEPIPAPQPVPASSGSLWAILIAGAALVIEWFRRR